MANNKVVLGNETIIDLTDATASADEILSGYSAYGADGNKLVGTADVKGDTIIIVNYDDEFRGQTITCSKSGTTYTKTAPSNKNEVRFYPTSTGEWNITCTLDGELYETSATIFTLDEIVECELEYLVDGSTVLPINDVPTWLKCAKLESLGYTTLAQVIEDTDTLEALLGDSNACAYLVRSTEFAKAVGQVPVMTSATTPSGVVTQSSTGSYGTPYKAFDDDWSKTPNVVGGNIWYSNGSTNEWLAYEFTTAKKICAIKLRAIMQVGGDGAIGVKTFKIQYSDDNTIWSDATDTLTYKSTNNVEPTAQIFTVNDVGSHKWWRIYIFDRTTTSSTFYIGIANLQFYLDADFATNEQAMTILGKYDYACDVLLADVTWAEAIAESEYWESVLDITVPKMTSATAPSGEVTSTVNSGDAAAWRAFDKNLTDGWNLNAAGHQWIAYEFPSAVKIVKAAIWQSTNQSASVWGRAASGMFQAYDENSGEWVDVSVDFKTLPYASEMHIPFNANIGAYKKYRFDLQLNQAPHLYELQFYGRHSASLVPLVPTMTSNTTPSGVASASHEYSSTYASWKAFDGNSSTWWAGNNSASSEWLQYDFGESVKVNFVEFSTSTSANHLCIKDYVIKGSNDGTNWIDLYAETLPDDASLDGVILRRAIQNQNAYRYYRFDQLSTYTNNLFAIYTLQFYFQEPTVDLIHSAPYDTIYYLDNGVEVPVTTTDINGIGEIDYSNLPQGDVTLYSSVAKDLADLSKDYRKTIKNTPNRVESWLMPILNNLYWFGWGETIIPTLYSSKTSSYALSSGSTSAKNTNDTTLRNSTYPNTCALWQYRIIDLTNVTTIKALLKDMSRFSGTNTFISIRVYPTSNIQNNGSIYVDNAVLGQYSTQHAGTEDYEEWVSLDVSSLSGEYIVAVGGSSNGSGRTSISYKLSAFLYVKE